MNERVKKKTLGLDEIEANALFAWQNRLFYEFIDDSLFKAFKSVEKKADKIGMSREEMKKVEIDEGWVEWRLLKQAEKHKNK